MDILSGLMKLLGGASRTPQPNSAQNPIVDHFFPGIAPSQLRNTNPMPHLLQQLQQLQPMPYLNQQGKPMPLGTAPQGFQPYQAPNWNPSMGGAPGYMNSAQHAPIPSFMGNRYAQSNAGPEFTGRNAVDPRIFGYPPDDTNLYQ